MSVAVVVIPVGGGGAGVGPRPVEGRGGRPRNRRLRAGVVPRGPQSRGGLRVLGVGDGGVTGGEASTSVAERAASLLAYSVSAS